MTIGLVVEIKHTMFECLFSVLLDLFVLFFFFQKRSGFIIICCAFYSRKCGNHARQRLWSTLYNTNNKYTTQTTTLYSKNNHFIQHKQQVYSTINNFIQHKQQAYNTNKYMDHAARTH